MSILFQALHTIFYGVSGLILTMLRIKRKIQIKTRVSYGLRDPAALIAAPRHGIAGRTAWHARLLPVLRRAHKARNNAGNSVLIRLQGVERYLRKTDEKEA